MKTETSLGLVFALLGPLAACTGTAPESVPAPIGEPELDVLARTYGFRDPERWMSVDVSRSVVTDGRRRIRFEKDAVAAALLAHRGGVGFEAAPMHFPDGTIFVAERFDGDEILDTEILRVRSEGAPEFLLFGPDGSREDTFHQPDDPPDGPEPGNVPEVCLGCHLGSSSFDPMMSFPTEPPQLRVEIDPRYRNEPIVLRFLEAYHRGGGVFGPYGSILLSQLFADARDGTLGEGDGELYRALRERHPEILIFDPARARTPETTSLLGEPLFPPPIPPQRRETLVADLEAAWADHLADPADEEGAIWLGRRLAYLGKFRDAIDVFSGGIEEHPGSYRLRRHRGHRWITLRRFDLAIEDLARAAELAAGLPDEVEPDGAPNAFGIPTSTDQSNIWYHLGLAHYLEGDLEAALAAYRSCLERSANPDMLCASTYWLHMILRRLGRGEEAVEVLGPIRADMEILENHAYHRLLLHFRGEIGPDEVLEGVAEGSLEHATRSLGLGTELLWSGELDAARRTFEHILEGPVWAAFGRIAAEAELARMIP